MHRVVALDMEKDLLEANRRLAEENHSLLLRKGVRSVDIMGGIGSGKTLLIERLSELLTARGKRTGAIVGDVAGDEDYRRLTGAGIPCINVNTGKECHVDAHLAEHAMEELDLDNMDILFIENVGNLVCPADFPLGTDLRVVVISVTEGDDMVRKHPGIFREADVIVVNKSDLAEIMEVDAEVLISDANRVKPTAPVIVTDARRGRGIEELAEALGFLG